MSGYLCLLSLCPWVFGQKSHAEEAFVVSPLEAMNTARCDYHEDIGKLLTHSSTQYVILLEVL